MAKDKIKNYLTKKGITICIDEAKCISCGVCAEIAPNTFELRKKDMICEVKESSVDNLDIINEAIESCTMGAITIGNNKK